MVQVIEIGLAMILGSVCPVSNHPRRTTGGHVEGTACKNQIPSHEHKLMQLTRRIQETEKGIGVRFERLPSDTLACETIQFSF